MHDSKVLDEVPVDVSKQYLYTLQDVVAERYHPPFLSISDRTAVRATLNMLKDFPNPRDYKLWIIGSFDIVTGSLVVCQSQEIILFPVETKSK